MGQIKVTFFLVFFIVTIFSSVLNLKASPLNWPEILRKNKENLQTLEGGYTNKTFVLRYQGNKYVVKYLASNGKDLGVNRTLEFEFQNAAAKIGLAPPVLYLDENKGIYVAEFLDGKPLSSQNMQNPNTLIRVIQTLKKIHKKSRYKPYKIGSSALEPIGLFMQQLRNRQSLNLPSLEAGYSFLLEMQKKLPNGEFQVALHNDFFSANLIQCVDSIKLIDWEYAGWGSAYNDLARCIAHDGIAETLYPLILATYFGEASQERLAILKRFVSIQTFVIMCWYAIQLTDSSTKKDHPDYQKQYEKYLKLFQISIQTHATHDALHKDLLVQKDLKKFE